VSGPGTAARDVSDDHHPARRGIGGQERRGTKPGHRTSAPNVPSAPKRTPFAMPTSESPTIADEGVGRFRCTSRFARRKSGSGWNSRRSDSETATIGWPPDGVRHSGEAKPVRLGEIGAHEWCRGPGMPAERRKTSVNRGPTKWAGRVERSREGEPGARTYLSANFPRCATCAAGLHWRQWCLPPSPARRLPQRSGIGRDRGPGPGR
jgi:hypothetical protein